MVRPDIYSTLNPEKDPRQGSRQKPCFCGLDSPIRDPIFAAMSKLVITLKVIRLCRMTLSDFSSFVKVGMHLFETLNNVRALRQGDPLSCDLFHFVMEYVLQKAGICSPWHIF